MLSATYFAISGQPFGTTDYWDVHGFFFLIFIATFPRLTLLFSSVASGGFFWWLGWLFAPRILVAILATLAYGNTNPILVTFAWLFAIGGESAEKVVVRKRVINVNRMKPSDYRDGEVIDI